MAGTHQPRVWKVCGFLLGSPFTCHRGTKPWSILLPHGLLRLDGNRMWGFAVPRRLEQGSRESASRNFRNGSQRGQERTCSVWTARRAGSGNHEHLPSHVFAACFHGFRARGRCPRTGMTIITRFCTKPSRYPARRIVSLKGRFCCRFALDPNQGAR